MGAGQWRKIQKPYLVNDRMQRNTSLIFSSIFLMDGISMGRSTLGDLDWAEMKVDRVSVGWI